MKGRAQLSRLDGGWPDEGAIVFRFIMAPIDAVVAVMVGASKWKPYDFGHHVLVPQAEDDRRDELCMRHAI